MACRTTTATKEKNSFLEMFALILPTASSSYFLALSIGIISAVAVVAVIIYVKVKTDIFLFLRDSFACCHSISDLLLFKRHGEGLATVKMLFLRNILSVLCVLSKQPASTVSVSISLCGDG